MNLFQPLYERVMRWSNHRHAERYLGGMSFMESSFFPIPVDLMLIPMVVRKPNLATRYAFISTVTSVLGGLFGYLIGMWAFYLVEPLLVDWGYMDSFKLAEQWFEDWGFWAIFVAGFSPIPYKVFTIAAGTLAMFWLPFVLASLIGRGLRFFLVAYLSAWLGPKAEPIVRRNVEILGWLTVVLLILAYLLLK